MSDETATTDDFQFEVAIPYKSESYRNLAHLPDWLNPWHYRMKRRIRNEPYKQWGDWILNSNDAVPGDFTPYVVEVRKTDNSTYTYEQLFRVIISASSRDNARARVDEGLATKFGEYRIGAFDSDRFFYRIGRGQGIL